VRGGLRAAKSRAASQVNNMNATRACGFGWAMVLVAGWLAGAPTQAADADGFRSLFNGRDLAGWEVPEPNPFWRVAEGILIGENDAEKKGSMLWTEESFRDFVFECEARWQGEIDSGVIFRKTRDGKRQLQVQMGVSRSLKQDMTGSFYVGGQEKYPDAGRAKNLESCFRPGDWNHFRIEARGDTFRVWINGQAAVTNYVNTNFPLAGPIGLQIHPGLPMKVEFRNLRVRRLD